MCVQLMDAPANTSGLRVFYATSKSIYDKPCMLADYVSIAHTKVACIDDMLLYTLQNFYLSAESALNYLNMQCSDIVMRKGATNNFNHINVSMVSKSSTVL